MNVDPDEHQAWVVRCAVPRSPSSENHIFQSDVYIFANLLPIA